MIHHGVMQTGMTLIIDVTDLLCDVSGRDRFVYIIGEFTLVHFIHGTTHETDASLEFCGKNLNSNKNRGKG